MKDGRLVLVEWEGRARARRDVILELAAAGVPVAEIARRLRVRYQIVYTTLRGGRAVAVEPPRPPIPVALDLGPVDAVLLGCVKSKDTRPRPARDLYTSELFRRRRLYAEASGRPWWIVSAEYGLVAPDEVIEPYDTMIARRPLHERHQIASQVADRLERELGGLRGRQLELHAGDEYCQAICPTLRQRGATVVRPLEGLGFGRQLAWYGERLGLSKTTQHASGTRVQRRPSPRARDPEPSRALALGDGRGLGKRITALFQAGDLDLGGRAGAPPVGWAGMPEVVAVEALRRLGAGPVAIRQFLTFNAAMDRARDADRLATSAARLFASSPWVYDPAEVARRSLRELADELRAAGVSQRHSTDAFGWRILAETLADTELAPEARSAIHDGRADARRLIAELDRETPSGTPLFPLLGGPKVGPLWVRLLAFPGGAEIASLEAVPVAVDVQVRKVTEYLGVTDTAGRDLGEVRTLIQATWARDVAEHGADGPDGLQDTPGALDPALWFFAKWGCTFCERARQRLPIAPVCGECTFGAGAQ